VHKDGYGEEDKSKSVVVDKLVLGIGSPFTKRVDNNQLPEKFKVLQIRSYVGDRDPFDHLENFRAHLDLHGTLDEVGCRAFSFSLSGNAQDLFRKLPLNSVDKFKELCKIFLMEFLNEFMAPFNREKMAVEDQTEDMVFAAFYQVISPKEPLMKKLA